MVERSGAEISAKDTRGQIKANLLLVNTLGSKIPELNGRVISFPVKAGLILEYKSGYFVEKDEPKNLKSVKINGVFCKDSLQAGLDSSLLTEDAIDRVFEKAGLGNVRFKRYKESLTTFGSLSSEEIESLFL